MRVLILEDNPERQQIFLHRYPDAVIVATAPECVERLSEHFDVVFLDHDLGGHSLPNSDIEDCGRLVVLYILERDPDHLKRTKFIVHSANVHRARGMTEDLLQAGYDAEHKPFMSLLSELKDTARG